MKILFVKGRWAKGIENSEKFKKLETIAEVEVTGEIDQKLIREKARDAVVIITGAPISAEVIEAARNLKLIQTTTVGYDQIDVEAAKKNGVVLCNVAEANANSVAELTFGLILDLARRISIDRSPYEARGMAEG